MSQGDPAWPGRNETMAVFLNTKYTAEIFGSSWSQGPVAKFPTITAAREWAEEYGTTADCCIITDAKGREVASHRRDMNGSGTLWHKTPVA